MPLFLLLLTIAQFVSPQAPVRYSYKVINSFPHDRNAFTQGLEFKDGIFYEGTGLNNRSSVRRVNPSTGEVLQKVDVPGQYFGEGITVIDDRILELTWKNEEGFIYNRKTLKQIGKFKYSGEGWGLANDGKQIYMSDGSANIRILDPKTLQEIRRITVKNAGRPIDQINELEYIDGEIWANVWQTDFILRISPKDGQITGIIDLTGILKDTNGTDVLNGIAWDAVGKRLFVTGKLWPKIFQIELVKGR
ncbi:glutaminyl-peptide cyclotransferase [Bryobacter aggregatus]|uniref:glutaminyl-peptide cyclotransferase n=1 Tax=Bryobacter aggregatus TaxID=360054 RepID=UPI00055EDE69|nr:glutaminyl-peptide cyclotransferase [Bryobacter aggregatus]